MSGKYHETENFEDGVVALTNDCGEVVNFFHVGTIEYAGEWYAFFKPAVDLGVYDTDELLIFKIEGDEKNEELIPVKDEPLLSEVYDAFMRELSEEDDDEPLPNTGCCGGGCCESKGDCNNCRGCLKK